MRKLIRYFNENKQKILIIIGMLAFIIFIIHFINDVIRINNENQSNNLDINTSTIHDITIPNKSTISNTKLPKETAEKNAKIISEFVDNCNKKNYEIAYNLLSSDCKEIVYKEINSFISNYVENIFSTSKIYSLELLQGSTYKIIYTEDNLLATGGISSSKNFVDYITIVEQNEELKLNINSFIKVKMMDKKQTYNDITIKINSKIIYLNYEIYNIQITNNTINPILIYDMNDIYDITLIDDNVEYSMILNGISNNKFIVEKNETNEISCRFNKTYEYNNETEYLQFKKIYMNYNQYKESIDKKELETISAKIKV